MYNYNIGVTGLNATDNPAPGIAVIRSIRESGNWKGKIIGLAYDALDTGIFDKDLLDEVYLIPYPPEGEEALLNRLKIITGKSEINIIIPTLDSEVVNFSRLKNDLEQLGIKMLLSGETQLKMRSKSCLGEFCREHNFLSPGEMSIYDPGLINKCASEIGFPLIIKALFHGAHLVYSIEECMVYFQKLKSQWGLPIIFQKYIFGEEYDVVALSDHNSKLIGAVGMRKLRITDKGKAWAGVSMRDVKLLELTERFLEKLQWIGPLELEFVKESSSGNYYLIEINPRFPSWVYLATKAGQNLPFATVLLAAGQDVKPFEPYQTGLTFVRHALDLVCPLSYLEDLTMTGELILNKERKE